MRNSFKYTIIYALYCTKMLLIFSALYAHVGNVQDNVLCVWHKIRLSMNNFFLLLFMYSAQRVNKSETKNNDKNKRGKLMPKLLQF